MSKKKELSLDALELKKKCQDGSRKTLEKVLKSDSFKIEILDVDLKKWYELVAKQNIKKTKKTA